ncbi:hypothetical protein CPB97_004692 [Podila verticillata]|nr:hypothetical protein CPB97_004692 [Podila verticillata]
MLARTYITYVAVAALALVSMISAVPVIPDPAIPGLVPGSEQYFVACCVQNVAACCVKVSLYSLGLLTRRVRILYTPALPVPRYCKNRRKHPRKSRHMNDLLHRTVAKSPQTPIKNARRDDDQGYVGQESMGVKVDWSDSRPDTASAALLDEYYKDLVIRSDDNYGNSERMGERRQQKSFEAMGNPWTTAPRQARFNSDPLGKTIKSPRLPELKRLVPEHMFFVSYARSWSPKAHPDALLKDLRYDEHASSGNQG